MSTATVTATPTPVQHQQHQHPLFGPSVVTGIKELGPYPDEQVEQTIELMRERVRQDSRNPEFQGYARKVLSVSGGVNGLEEQEARGVAERAWAHVKRAIQFKRDEELGGGLGGELGADTVEFIVRPAEMAKFVQEGRAYGDCDDFSMYLAALLEACGVPCSFVTVAADGRAPEQYSHVYVRAYPGVGMSKPLALDASHGAYAGWEVPDMFGKWREWPVNEDGTFARMLKNLLVIAGGIAGAVYLWKELHKV